MILDTLTPDEHQQLILELDPNQTMIVQGVAGSGKSLCLLWKARQVSTRTESYAIIVYTKTLKQFFVDELAEINPTGEHIYYHEEWKSSSRPYVDYMFVDECQDFSAEEIEDFRSHGRYCWFFGDTDQSIMDFKPQNGYPGHSTQSIADTATQLGADVQDLCINHRLTVENAKVGDYIKPGTELLDACYLHGDKPLQIESNTQLDDILKLCRERRFVGVVAILAYYNRQVSLIKDHLISNGVPVRWKIDDEISMDFKDRSMSPIIMTFHCAKGLQFQNVVIPFGESFRYQDEKDALYVACTRALTHLVIMHDRGPCRYLPPVNSDIYGNPQNKSYRTH